MPLSPTFPGVYLEEAAGGVRTITGVSTAITAFLGRAAHGPMNEATVVNSVADYERSFGGLSLISPLSYAVRDFFLNGGREAVIIRLFHPTAGVPDRTHFKVGFLPLDAADPGGWGVDLRAVLGVDVDAKFAARQGLTARDLFNLTVTEAVPGGRSERFGNITLTPGNSRQIAAVLTAESKLVRLKPGVNAVALKPDLANLHAQDKTLQDAKAALGKEPTNPAKQNDYDKAGRDWDNLACDELTAAERDVQRKQQNLARVRVAVGDVRAAQKALDDAAKALKVALNLRAEGVSDGEALGDADLHLDDGEEIRSGVFALDAVDLFNLLCVPQFSAETPWAPETFGKLAAYCARRRAFLLVDAPSNWSDKGKVAQTLKDNPTTNLDALGVSGTVARNAAVYFPRLLQPNPLRSGRVEEFAPCGAIAGVFAHTDATRGVWKAPAGLDAVLVGTPALSASMTDAENGLLNPVGINCLRTFPAAGRVVWGARTLRGADALADDYKYVPVRRTALFMEESLYRSTQWAIFEPNDEPLWAQLRLDVGSFLHDLFRRGAFQGGTPKDAYFVKCDKETTTPADVNRGVVNLVVGFAPVKPAEFVVIRLQQLAGQLDN